MTRSVSRTKARHDEAAGISAKPSAASHQMCQTRAKPMRVAAMQIVEAEGGVFRQHDVLDTPSAGYRHPPCLFDAQRRRGR